MSSRPAASRSISHIVMWDVVGKTAAEKADAIAAIQREFEGLKGLIPGLTKLEIGVDTSRISYACDLVLVTEFESQGALDAYATHPAHLDARNRLEGLRIARHQVDYLGQDQEVWLV